MHRSTTYYKTKMISIFGELLSLYGPQANKIGSYCIVIYSKQLFLDHQIISSSQILKTPNEHT